MMGRLSIRWRLTLWNTLAFAALLLAFSTAVYGLQRHALYEQTERLLASQFEELHHDRRMSDQTQQRLEYWVREFKEHVNVFAIVYDSIGSVVTRTEELAPDSVPSSPPEVVDEPRFATAAIPLLGPQRVMTGRFRVGNDEFTVLLMTSLEDVNEELGHLFTVLIVTVPLSLVLAAVIGYGLARNALSPIDQLRVSTDQITADRLNQRLSIANPTDELGRLATTLNGMIERLERSFLEMKRFTADAAHELRTPLAVIRNEAEVTLRTPRSSAEYSQVLENILIQTQRLTQLVDQLLFLCRQDAGIQRPVCDVIQLDELLREIMDDMNVLAHDKDVQLSIRDITPSCVRGDAHRLRAVFFNLLDNAIKYTPAGRTVTIDSETDGEWVKISIIDTGIGISAEHLSRIFQRFYRADPSRSADGDGTGLGLSICQSILQAHSGSIDVKSAVGKGTEFTVRLPAYDSEESLV